jgi:hypothetical protein
MKFSGEFSILEGNNIVSFGRIYASDDTLQKQNLIYDKKSDKDFDLILDSNDVYKELRIRGYDYGPKFRGIQELRIEDSKKVYGSIEWTGNMIPFMDSLIQSHAIALPFRKIFVPVMIASIRCDPKKFFDSVEESKVKIDEQNKSEIIKEFNEEIDTEFNTESDDKKEFRDALEKEAKLYEGIVSDIDVKFRSKLTFFANISLKTVVTHGIEINGLLAVPINRKTFNQDLELESYQFIANEENDAIEQIHKKDITEYIQV